MTRRLCRECMGRLVVEGIGRRPRRLVAYCPACNLAYPTDLEVHEEGTAA